MNKYWLQALDGWNYWQALSPGRKLVWLLGVGGCLAFAGMLWWAVQPEYRVLYAGLSAEESGAITSKLQAKGVPFKLAAGGTTILVPVENAMQVHLDLTAEGVAGSSKVGKGLDLFDQPMIGATPFNQHVNFLRAQQAELARTIMQMEPILFARVHIVRPEPSPFVRDQKPATASVMVKVRPGATLDRNTVNGIAALVAGSVEGLTKENVKIADSTGRLLSKHLDSESGVIGSIVDQKREIEQYLAVEAERMLTAALGPGRAVVVVRAELDNKMMHEKKEIIDADKKVQKSEKTTLNKTNSTGPGKGGGVVGFKGNQDRSGANSGPTGTTSTQETQQYEYEYPRIVQEWQHKHGSIERLTVAAFVDIEGSNTSMPLDDIKEIIKKAVCFKADRDEIQVTQVKMPSAVPEGLDEDWAKHEKMQNVLTFVRYGSIAMVALCVLPMGWMFLRRRKPATTETAAPQLRLISETFERDPEALAKVLSAWMERPEASDRKAA